MCGITGFLSSSLDFNHLKEMTSIIGHRGPDSEGFYYNPIDNIGLGHKRLSIIDISSSASQPMQSHCKKYTMVYNGEVYNYKEISKQINREWRTSSDSEVILEAYVEYGLKFVDKLNGMFALAIYDSHKKELILARDRMGIKPLYYHLEGNNLIFSSELKCIKKTMSLKVNKQVISSFLHLGYIPRNDTFYENTLKFPSSSIGVFKNNKLEIKPYWSIESRYESKTITNIEDAKSQLDLAINKSVKYRLISDVPLGCFLSGGIDSSLIAAIAKRNSSKNIDTFSIGFKDSKYNESKYANDVAKKLNTNHHEYILSEIDALDALDKVMLNFDQPFLDSSAIPTYLVSNKAKKHVSVCLSGDGGDELFMGYGSYNWVRRLNNPFTWALRKPMAYGLNKFGNTTKRRGAKVLNAPRKNLMSHIFSQEQYLFSEKEISLISNINHNFESFHLDNTVRSLSKLEKQSLFDLKNYLKDDLLIKVDMSSMLNSLELRVPLLDHNVVELALNIDQKLKFNNAGQQKYILKEVLYEYLPAELFERPKWGFAIPLEKWLKTDLKHIVDQYVNREVLNELQIYNTDEVMGFKNRFSKDEPYNWNKLWSIIILNKFLLNE